MFARIRAGWRNPLRRRRAATSLIADGSVAVLATVVAVAIGPGALRWVLAVMALLMALIGIATAIGNLTALRGYYLGDDDQ